MREFDMFLADLTVHVYVAVLIASFAVVKLKPRNAASLFVWACSMPLTVFCSYLWVYRGGFDMWVPMVILINMFAFAQVGWLGAALDLLGVLVRIRGIRRAGLAISIISIVGHGLFIGLMVAFADP